MRKPDKKEHINLFFSAFLIIAFIVCANFFAKFTENMDLMTGRLITAAVYAVFGILLFYATRVGDGKAILRFSPLTLIVMVLPTLLIILATLFEGMPLHKTFAPDGVTGLSVVTSLAAIAFGYGLPYSFVSGFELKTDDAEAEEDTDDDHQVLEGGIEEDLLDEEDSDEEAAENNLDESSYDNFGLFEE